MRRSTSLTTAPASHRPVYLPVISVVAMGYLIYYLWWRVTSSLNPDAPVFSWMLLLAEAFGVCSYLLFAWMTRDISPTRHFRPAPAGLTVDILVPTYDESLDILEATLVGCNHVSYPHRTYLLDDGHRSEVQQLAVRLGIAYLTRDSSEHAKAGNLNAALARTHGQFVAVLDADMVPQRDLLDRSLGYFEDARLAVVQLPQEFYNQDSIQHYRKEPTWHEQALFFRIIQPGKNRSNSAFWCGSPSVIRRLALEDVGGVATSTVTEDIHTSVLWHSRGWSSYYLNEPLAFGIAPQTIRAFLVQRLRWASGTMQLYSSRESPLWIRGLTMRQRFSYFASFMAYFEAVQKLVLLATPAIIIVLGVFPMRVHIWEFVVRWVPYFAISLLANVAAGRGHFRYFQTEKYNLLKMVVFIQAILILFTRKPQRFEVTPKSVGPQVYAAEARSLWAYLVIYAILTASVLFGLLKINSWASSGIGLEALIITLTWALYNAFTLLGGLSDVLSRPHERQQYRFLVNLQAVLERNGISPLPARVQLRDISIGGVGLVADPGRTLMDLPSGVSFFSSHGKLIRLPLAPEHAHFGESGGPALIGASIVNPSPADRDRLFEFLYIDMPETWRRSPSPDVPARERVPAEQPLPEPVPVYATITPRT